MKTYKVWVSIELVDEETDEYRDLDLPNCLGEFGTKEEAFALRDTLEESANKLMGNLRDAERQRQAEAGLYGLP